MKEEEAMEEEAEAINKEKEGHHHKCKIALHQMFFSLVDLIIQLNMMPCNKVSRNLVKSLRLVSRKMFIITQKMALKYFFLLPAFNF